MIQSKISCYANAFVVTFVYFYLRKRFSDKQNQDVVTRLVAEAGKLDTSIPLLQLRGKTCSDIA